MHVCDPQIPHSESDADANADACVMGKRDATRCVA